MRYLWAIIFVFVFSSAYGQCDGWFIRGDVDNNDSVELVTDWIYLNNYLFSSGPAPCNPDAADVNDDGVLDLSDLIALQNWFNGSFQIPLPYPNAGDDPTGDFLQNDTSPMPNGNQHMPDAEDDDAFCLGYNNEDRWNISDDYTLGDGFQGVRVLESRNIQCNGDNKDQYDIWIVDFNVDKDSIGHSTHKALTSDFHNGKRDSSINLIVEIRSVINIDCECYDQWEDVGSNIVVSRLGMDDFEAFITLELESDSGETLTLGRLYHDGVHDKMVQTSGYTQCLGEGWSENTIIVDMLLDGYDIVASGNINTEEILKVSQVRVDGIGHLSLCKISEKRTGDELSKFESVKTYVNIDVKYNWREE